MSNPTAVLFQALPPLAPDEYRSLEESIEAHGIQVPIIVDETGVVIDGHHRQKIASHLGIECPMIIKAGYSEAEKRTLALSLNIDRRHLNREQKRALIAESIKADPQLPDLTHAKRTGVSPTTVGTVRRELEDSGDVSKLETRTDASGREQPASKPRPVVDPAPASEPTDNSELIVDPEPPLFDSGDQVVPGMTADDLAELNAPVNQGKRIDSDKAVQRIAEELEGTVFVLSMLNASAVSASSVKPIHAALSAIRKFVKEVESNG